MIFDPKTFYQTYQKDYHGVKALYLKKILDDPEKYEDLFFDHKLDDEAKQGFIRVIKSDLRQNYFHSIETFFELFFALNPKGKSHLDDELVLFNLTNSDWTTINSKVREISKNDNALDFLNDKMNIQGHLLTIGQYLFYNGIYSREKFPKELFEEIDSSVEAIKYGIKILATDISNKEEYNSYKHGLRLIPSVKSFMLADSETRKIKLEWDLSESMSFYSKTNDPEEVKIITKVYDSERDYQMTVFCSNLIRHMIFYRRISIKFESDLEKHKDLKITFFGKEPIEKCNSSNVPIQDLVYTVRPIKKE